MINTLDIDPSNLPRNCTRKRSIFPHGTKIVNLKETTVPSAADSPIKLWYLENN